jgi:hypothetical protein
MNARKPHDIWRGQCEAAEAIKARFRITAAFDYLIGEKLMNFVSAASQHPDFARELPRFVSEVRRMFSHDEIGAELEKIEQRQNEKTDDILDEEDPVRESSTQARERIRQFELIKELLTSTTLGTS